MFQSTIQDIICSGWMMFWIEDLGIEEYVVEQIISNPNRYLVADPGCLITYDKVIDHLERFFERQVPDYVREHGGQYRSNQYTSMLDEPEKETIAQAILKYLAVRALEQRIAMYQVAKSA